MPTLRVFIAHPKNVDDTAIQTLSERAERSIKQMVERLAPGVGIEIVTGRDDFMARSSTEGGWDAWCHSVAAGRTYRENTLQPRFDAIVIAPSPLFGKGTAKIVAEALRIAKPIYFLRENGALLPVTNLVEHDANDYQSGWSVQVRGSG